MATKQTIQQVIGDSPQRIVRRLIDDWNTFEDKHGKVPKRLLLRSEDFFEIDMECDSILCSKIIELRFLPKKDRRIGQMEVVFSAKTYGFE